MPLPAHAAKARPLSLAFSGGGAKCAAQAGVLAVLDEARLPVGAIAGTSGGGLVAILYGLGYTPHAILEYIAGTHLLEVWDIDASRRALFGAEKIRSRVRTLVGDKTFADLKLPVTVVAADITAKQEVDLNTGPLEEAIRATMAIPLFFVPVCRGQATLIDGGAVNPLPVDVARRQGPRVVAVDVMHDTLHYATNQIFEARGPMRYATEAVRRLGLMDMLNISYEAVTLVTVRMSELNLRLTPPDLLLQPVVGQVGLFAFDLARQAYQAGEAAARAALPQIEALVYPTARSQLAAAMRPLRRR